MRFKILILLAAMLGGCAELPHYARPSQVNLDMRLSEGKSVTYQALSVSDFQANSLSEEKQAHAGDIGAYSVIKHVPYVVLDWRELDGEQPLGRVKAIVVGARFVREHSWWNSQLDADEERLVLEHEQIHFAIAESHARDMSFRASELASSINQARANLVPGSEAYTAAGEEFSKRWFSPHAGRQLEFDSAVYRDADAQRRWRETLDSELQRDTSRTREGWRVDTLQVIAACQERYLRAAGARAPPGGRGQSQLLRQICGAFAAHMMGKMAENPGHYCLKGDDGILNLASGDSLLHRDLVLLLAVGYQSLGGVDLAPDDYARQVVRSLCNAPTRQ